MSILSTFAFDYKSKLCETMFIRNVLKADFCVGAFRYKVKSFDKEKGTVFMPVIRNDIFAPRNSFIPDIRLKIVTDEQGTRAQVCLRLKTAVLVFASVYMTIAALFQILLFVMALMDEVIFSIVLFLPSLLVLFMFLMTFIGGYFSARRVKAEIMSGVFGE